MAEEIKNQGQQEYAENISGQAKEIISAALEETKNNGTSPVLGDPNVTDNFKGLPMRELIAAPLIAAAEAQQELAATAWNFYQKIAFDEDGKTARVLEFDIKRPIQQDGKMTTMSQSVKAPFIGLVPIPSLLIDRVDVDFQMEVTDTSNVKTRVRDNILKSKEQKNIQPTKGGHKMVTCQNYVSLFYCQITSCPSDGGIS